MAWPQAEEIDEVEDGEEAGPWEQRATGTAAHFILQRIARDGLAAWPMKRLDETKPFLRTQLPEEAVEQCLRALRATLRSERGRWILGDHAEARNEWPLTGRIGDQLYSVILDRTFIDEAGTRWIIDYKTGSQTLAHREQLQRYGLMVSALDARPIRLGLYYPLSNEWNDWAFTISLPGESTTARAEG